MRLGLGLRPEGVVACPFIPEGTGRCQRALNHFTINISSAPGTAAALRAVSWAKAPGVVDVILLRDGRM